MNSLDYFNSIAKEWNVIREDYFEEKLKYISISEFDVNDKICADLACGTGFISLALAEKAKLVFSIDNSRNMLRELHDTSMRENKKNIYPIRGSVDDLPLFDGSIDAVYINMGLHHIANAKEAISEMYRILKKHGTVAITDVEEHDGEWARVEMHDEWLGFSHEQIESWFKEAGFSGIKVRSTGLKCKGYSSKGEHTETGIFLASGIKEED